MTLRSDEVLDGEDPIDRLLASGPVREHGAELGPAFEARVMAAVRRAARTPPPLRFPWERIAAGSAASLAWLGFVFHVARSGAPSWTLGPATLVLAAVCAGLLCLRFVRFCARS